MSAEAIFLGLLVLAGLLIVAFRLGRRSGTRVVIQPKVELTMGITRTVVEEEPVSARPARPRPAARRHQSERQEAAIREAMTRPRIALGSNESPTMNIVGESYHQHELQTVAGDRLVDGVTADFVALVVPEPENPYDPNAIMVLADGVGQIGHFGREDAGEYHEVAELLFACGAVGVCEAWLKGGSGKAISIGAELYIDGPAVLVGRLREMLPIK